MISICCLFKLHDALPALIHEPFRRAGGTADTNRLLVFEPLRAYIVGTFYLITVRIYRLTFIEKHLAVRAFFTTYEEYHIVARGKRGNVGHAVGHLSANGVKALKGGTVGYMRLNVIYYT